MPPEPTCGDGVVDPYEECDDGNRVDDDVCNLDCVATASIVWDVVIPSEGEGACAHALAVSPAGLIAAGGRTRMGPEFVNAWVGVLDDGGALQWSDQWDGGDQARDEVMDVAFDATDELHLAVSEADGGPRAAWLYKRGPDGTPRWGVSMVAAPDEDYGAGQLVIGPDGGATVVTEGSGDGVSFRMLRYTPDGAAAWPSPVDIASDVSGEIVPFGLALGQDAAGGLSLIVVRYSGGPVGMYLAFLEHYSAAGVLEWSVSSNPPVAGTNDEIVLGATRPDGRTTMVLFDEFAPDDMVLRSWDAAGVGPDAASPGVSADLRLQDATYDSQGNLVVVANDVDWAWTIKIDATGELAWTRRFSGGGNGRIEAVAVTAADDVLVAGCTDSNDGDVWIRRYTP